MKENRENLSPPPETEASKTMDNSDSADQASDSKPFTEPVPPEKKEFVIGLRHLLILLFVVICIRMTLMPIPIADTWWLLKSGEVILTQKAIPATEVFSYTAQGLPWVNHEWLACLLYFLIYKIGKFYLLYAFKSGVILLSYILVALIGLRETGKNFGAVFLAASIMVLCSGGRLFFDVRAYLFTYLLLALTLLILHLGYYAKKDKLLYLLVPVTLLWINTHGGFILSYVLQLMFLSVLTLKTIIARFGINLSPLYRLLQIDPASIDAGGCAAGHNEGESCEKPHKPFSCTLSSASFAFLLSIAAGFLNPYKGEIFLYPFSLWNDSFYKRGLIEWISPFSSQYFNHSIPFFVVCTLVALLAFAFYKKLRLTDFLILGAFSYLGLTVVRHAVLYSIAVLPIFAVLLSSAGEVLAPYVKIKSKILKSIGKILSLSIFAVTIIVSVVFLKGIRIDDLTMEKTLFPSSAVEFIKMNPLPGRMYNPYEWGGYLIWKLYPEYKVFIDGRANTVYPEEVFKESNFTMQGRDGWEKILNKYDVNFVLCNKILRETDKHLLPDRLAEDPDWQPIFEDENVLIFIKNTPQNREIIEKAVNNRLKYPMTPWQVNRIAGDLIDRKQFKEALKLLDELLKREPDYIPAMDKTAYVYLLMGENDKAIAVYDRLLAIAPKYPRVHFNLGMIYEQKGDLKKARYHYEIERDIDQSFVPAYDRLLQLDRMEMEKERRDKQ